MVRHKNNPLTGRVICRIEYLEKFSYRFYSFPPVAENAKYKGIKEIFVSGNSA